MITQEIGMYRTSRRSRFALAACSVLAGGTYGLGTSLIPSPSGIGVFWISNLASPWLVIAFLSGWLQRSRIWAALAGVACDVACVVGFYGHFLIVDQNIGPHGRGSALLARMTGNLHTWLTFIAPWVAVAVSAGAVFGMLGWWWGRSRTVLAGALLGLPFLVEPWVWREGLGYDKGPWVPWMGETVVGVAIMAWAVIFRRRDARSPQTHSRI